MGYKPWSEYSSFGWVLAFIAFIILLILTIIGGMKVDPAILVWFVLLALLARLV